MPSNLPRKWPGKPLFARKQWNTRNIWNKAERGRGGSADQALWMQLACFVVTFLLVQTTWLSEIWNKEVKISEQQESFEWKSRRSSQWKIYSDLQWRIASPAPHNLWLHYKTCNVVFLLFFVVHTMRQDFVLLCVDNPKLKWNNRIFRYMHGFKRPGFLDLRFNTNTTRKFKRGKFCMFVL